MKQLLEIIAAITPIIVGVAGVYIAAKVNQIHTIVNSQRTALEQRVIQLEDTIRTSDKPIPKPTRETGRQ